MLENILVYIGTYTEPIKFGTGRILDSKGEGIYLLKLDFKTGELNLIEVFKKTINPSYLTINKKTGCLYTVNELKEFQGKPSGSVTSFKISDTSGKLTYINTQPTGGTDPCHVETNLKGTHLYVSNFMSGSVCVFPLNPDGSIGESSQFIQHVGSSMDLHRQSGPHAHSLVFSPDGQFAFVPDLGLDKVMIYAVDANTQTLVPAAEPFFRTQPGAGPRHCTFEPNGAFCYLINELDSTILGLSFDQKNGKFVELQCVSSLPEGITVPGNTCADVHITQDGNFLYGSNRGHNSLVIYKINKKTGLLEFAGCHSCGGETPRNFAIDPTGNFLICANQDSDDVVVFKIDPETGSLCEKSRIKVPTPVCVQPFIL
jgi:6-phosphogluconolactonase